MVMGRQRGRNRSFDKTIIKNELKEINDSTLEKKALGDKFIMDKEKLEQQYEIIESSDLSSDEKKEQLEKLKEAIRKLEEEYENQVTEPIMELNNEAEEKITELEEMKEMHQQQETSLREVKLDAGSMDGSFAANEAAKKKESIEKYRKEEVQKIHSKMEQLQQQQRKMRADRLRRGR